MFKQCLFLLAFFVPFFGLNWMNSPVVIAQSTQEPASPDTGTPEGQQGVGGTRPETSCPDTGGQNLTALVQGRGQDLTQWENPVIWVYIPYSQKDISYLEFSLHDRHLTQTFYRTAIEVTDSPGLIKMILPYALVPTETYRWYLKLYCQPHQPGGNTKYYYLQNWIQYQPNAPVEMSWYDRITEVGDRYFTHPDNAEFKEEWRHLLNLLELPEWLSQAPLVNSNLVPLDEGN
jgi:hypothetical protein